FHGAKFSLGAMSGFKRGQTLCNVVLNQLFEVKLHLSVHLLFEALPHIGLLSGVQHEPNRCAQPLPTFGLGLQLLIAKLCKAVEFRFASVYRFPMRFQHALLFEAVERRVEGALADLEGIAGDLLKPLGDAVAVHWLEGENLEDEEVEGALKKAG